MADSGISTAQPILLTAHAGAAPPSARVQCEILPVTCAEGHIIALARHPAGTAPMPGWCHELPPGRHPTQAVVEALTRELDPVFDQSTSVLHSTSWRYESEYLVLSYLAVLQPPLVSAPPGFVLQPVDTRTDRAGRTSDPSAIPVMDVLTHGLRHLAMLRVSDATVASTLAGCWHELLADWDPLPAGLLEHCIPTLHTTGVRNGQRKPTRSEIVALTAR
ncbi:MAG: hypothetical protein ACT4NY_23635 [Pseudonocardiales bacterium]